MHAVVPGTEHKASREQSNSPSPGFTTEKAELVCGQAVLGHETPLSLLAFLALPDPALHFYVHIVTSGVRGQRALCACGAFSYPPPSGWAAFSQRSKKQLTGAGGP